MERWQVTKIKKGAQEVEKVFFKSFYGMKGRQVIQYIIKFNNYFSLSESKVLYGL